MRGRQLCRQLFRSGRVDRFIQRRGQHMKIERFEPVQKTGAEAQKPGNSRWKSALAWTPRQSLRLVLLAGLLLAANPVAALTFNVNTTADTVDANTADGVCADAAGNCSLRAAIQEANFMAGTDTINLPAGLYLLDRTGIDDVAGVGDLDVTDTVEVVGAGTGQTTVEAVQRAFQVRIGGDLTLRDLTLRGVDEFAESVQSGCLDVFGDDARALADNVRFERVDDMTGAFCVSVSEGSFVADNSTFSMAGGFTAMINAYGKGPASITIRDSLVRQEVGAREFMRMSLLNLDVNQDLDVTIENSTFDSVSPASTNSGVLRLECDATNTRNFTISDSSFSGLQGPGGNPRTVIGVGNRPSGFNCDVSIRNSEFVDNDRALRITGSDGAISEINAVIESSTFSGNDTAIFLGPAGFQDFGPRDRLFLRNVTISGNTDFGLRTFNNARAFIENSTFANNGIALSNEGINDVFLDNSVLANSTISDCEGDFSGSFNLIEAGNCIRVDGPSDTIITGADPMLDPLANNGGPTRTHALIAGSPAIDSGDDPNCPATDQRGFSRPADGDGDSTATCDMGAFEKDAVLVTNQPPTAADDSASIDEDSLVTIAVADNDTDEDDNLDPTTANTACGTCSAPSNGLLNNNGDGTFDYTPAADFFGADSFVYEICDTDGACDTATVDIMVNPVNDPPTFAAGADPAFPAGTSGGQSIENWPQDIDLGPNEMQQVDSYTVITTSDPDSILAGPAAISSGGELTFPLTGASGMAQMEATLTDDGGTTNGGDDTSAPVAFSITVAEPAADLAASSLQCAPRAAPDEPYAYSIVITNNGPDDATGVAASHVPIPGADVNSLSSPACVDTGSAVDCDLGTITAGTDVQIGIEIQAPNAGAQLLQMTTSVVATTGDPNGGNNEDQATVEIVPGLVSVDGFENCTP